MKQYTRVVLTASMIVSLISAPSAQSSGFSAADSKELASYRLTMDTAKKVYALMRSLIQDIANDPKFQALQKTNAEIDTLSKKEELSEAETERIEKLQMQAEQQSDALDQAIGDMGLSNVGSLDQMEAAVKANPRLIGALSKAGLTARDYSKYHLAGLMAGMVAGFQKSGALKELPKELKEVHPDNVKFLLEHEAELTAMLKEVAEQSNALVVR